MALFSFNLTIFTTIFCFLNAVVSKLALRISEVLVCTTEMLLLVLDFKSYLCTWCSAGLQMHRSGAGLDSNNAEDMGYTPPAR